jgi:hypothetical protein
MPVLYTNNAVSNLSASITNAATSLSITAGTGGRFPAPTTPDYFYATLTDPSGEIEVVRVTARSTDTMTVVRGQDGTTARAWGVNAAFELRVNRAMLDDFKTDTRAGNAATATALQTARTIGGVSFNGTTNINLPGVNIAGNQNTTGNAATATTLQTARTINGTSFNGSANITTANWGTARTLSFTGDVTGSASVNGSANVATAMTLANSGVTAASYGGNNSIPSLTVDAKGRVTAASTVTPSGTWAISISGSSASTTGNAATVTNGVYTTGDQTIGGSKTFSSPIRPPASAQSWIGGHRGNSAVSIATTGTTSSFHGWVSQRTPSGGFALGTLNDEVYLTWATNANIDANTNTVFNALRVNSAGTVTAPTFSGALSGNATTATTLQTARLIGGVSFNGSADINLPGVNTAGNQNTTGSAATLTTARTINGTSFNGSANITTANWGTARTLTIGSTGKSVNGSANVAWTLAEIGAPALTGGSNFTGAGSFRAFSIRTSDASAANWSWFAMGGTSDSAGNVWHIATNGTAQDIGNAGAIHIRGANGTASSVIVNQDHSVRFRSASVFLGATTAAGGTQVVTNSGTWGINITGSSASTTGNAATATALQTARLIGGVSFNGTANITLPGVNAAGNQNTTGNAATATTATNANNVAIAADTTSTTSFFVPYVSATTGNVAMRGTRLTVQPSTGNFTAVGTITANSDERLKKDWTDLPADFVERLALVKHGTYTRTDTDARQIGVSAQSLLPVAPEGVMEGEHLSVAYGNVALVSSIELAKRVVALEEELRVLKESRSG